MAALSTLAWVGLAVAAGGTALSFVQQQRAQGQAKDAANEQRKAGAIQSSQNSLAQAQEQRQQIREERIRRAQIMNQAEQSGASGSSGEIGATGALSTNLASNIGSNRSAIQAGQMITGFNQRAANFSTQAQTSMNRANMWNSISNVGSQVFDRSGGFKTIFS